MLVKEAIEKGKVSVNMISVTVTVLRLGSLESFLCVSVLSQLGKLF